MKKSARRRDYYETAKADGTTDMLIETMFGLLEDDAAPVLARIRQVPIGTFELDSRDRLKLAVFMAVQHVRVPAVQEAAESAAKLAKAAEIDASLAAEPDLLAEWRTGAYEALPPTGFVQLEMLSSAMAVLTPRFFDMGWRVLEGPGFPGLVLGDAPVSPMRPPGLPDDEWKGFAHPDVDVILPISPRRLLLLNGERSDDTNVEVVDGEIGVPSLERSWVYDVNEATWTRASQHIYGRSRADLEATRLALEPGLRQMVRRPTVKNPPPELAVHARDVWVRIANVAARRARLPASFVGLTGRRSPVSISGQCAAHWPHRQRGRGTGVPATQRPSRSPRPLFFRRLAV